MQIKKIFNSLTPTSIFWLVLGIIIFLYGVYIGYKWRMYYYSFGLLSAGFGGMICGLTNGFTDQSPKGRVISKFGIAALLIGVAMLVYYFYKFI